jgi:hypothetical protein
LSLPVSYRRFRPNSYWSALLAGPLSAKLFAITGSGVEMQDLSNLTGTGAKRMRIFGASIWMACACAFILHAPQTVQAQADVGDQGRTRINMDEPPTVQDAAPPRTVEDSAPPRRLTPNSAEAPRPSDPLAIYREAGINKDQENQIRQMAKEFDTANLARLQSVSSLMHEMQAMSLKSEPDEQAVLDKQDQISKAQAEMSTARIKLLLKIRSVLTKEQKQRLIDLMQKGMGAPTP